MLLARPAVARSRLIDARKALLAEGASFEALLADLGVVLDLDALAPAGRWLTPPYLKTRYDTLFFAASMSAGQTAEVWPGELASGAWISAEDALDRWRSGHALLHPPAHHLISCLRDAPLPGALAAMNEGPHLLAFVAQRIEFQAGILLMPVRTPTLAPATHTNVYLVGEHEVVVVDPASEYPDEQTRLSALCRELVAEGRVFREILLTHEHHDHIGGVEALRRELGVPVRAHRETIRLLEGVLEVDGEIAPDEVIALPGRLGLRLRAIFTPGHTPGHLCFFEETTGALLAGDMVAGIGSIVVDPPDGDMSDYMDSLRKLRALPVKALYPAHGPAIPDGPGKLDEYLAHREERERQIVAALSHAPGGTAAQLVPHVYADVPEAMYPLAARSLLAVLGKLIKEGRVDAEPDERFRLRTGSR